MLVSSHLGLNKDHNNDDETSGVQNCEDGDFPALNPVYDQRALTHHMMTGHNATENNIPDFVTGRPTQNHPLPEQFTQPQNMATHMWPNNTLPMVAQAPDRQISDSGNPINRHAEAITGIASQQRLPNVISIIEANNNDEHTNFWWQNREFWTIRRPISNYA